MFFISDAYAQTADGAMGSNPLSMLMFALPLLLVYILMIRPQAKRQKELKALIAAVKKGDDVSTIGGLVGKVAKLDDNFVTIATGTSEVTLQRGAIQSILPPGSLK